jgi:hypothetical protein
MGRGYKPRRLNETRVPGDNGIIYSIQTEGNVLGAKPSYLEDYIWTVHVFKIENSLRTGTAMMDLTDAVEPIHFHGNLSDVRQGIAAICQKYDSQHREHVFDPRVGNFVPVGGNGPLDRLQKIQDSLTNPDKK